MPQQLPQLSLPLSATGADASGPPPKKEKRRIQLQPAGPAAGPSGEDNTDYASVMLRLMPEPHAIWARPPRPEEHLANAQLQTAFGVRRGDAPGADDLIRVAQEVGLKVLSEEAKRAILAAMLPSATREYVLDFSARTPDGRGTRVDFALAPKWMDAFRPHVQRVPSFQAYTKMNMAARARMGQINRQQSLNAADVTSVERVMVVLPGAIAQQPHVDNSDLPLCTVALNVRQAGSDAGCTEFPDTGGEAQAASPSSRIFLTAGNEANPDARFRGAVHRVNNATGYVSAWDGRALHRGTGNRAQEPRVFLYTEWSFDDKHN